MGPFLSCDWGTSRFRLRLVEGAELRVAAEHVTDEGIQSIAAAHAAGAGREAAFGRVLDRGIAALGVARQSGTPVIISGMASSNLGWRPLPYARLPLPIDGRGLVFGDFNHAGRRLRIVSGAQAASDIMRGEETELVGLFSSPARRQLSEHCTAVLPGTHSKHVRLEGGQIVDFTTHLTGELYRLLCTDSTLCERGAGDFESDAFLEGGRAGRDLGMGAALFQTRARTILGLLPSRHGRAFLSGVLIGAEVSALADASVSRVVLAAGENLSTAYVLAFSELLPAIELVIVPPDEVAAASIAGHARLLHPET